MSHTPVTVAILAWNSWETTKACLDSLRPTLGVRDQVVVVDNGSTDGTATGLRGYPWVQVVTNPVNRGFAGGCNDAAKSARSDLIIFLNNDTLLAPKWIEPLVAAFEDPTVAAVGPRSNFVSGPQVVAEALYGSPAEMRRFARSWSAAHRAMTSPVERLVGFALAVRRSVFETIGGFDEGYGIGGFEDDDLCRRIIASGYKLLISHESFVHHDGHRTFDANGLDWYAEQESNRARFISTHGEGAADADRPVMISACLITKDEEARISDCLASLESVADEIIVYDTGSQDSTIELARAAGATVVEGFWDDDFSRARNEALSYCSGEWIVWVDADETLQVDDPTKLRSLLAATRLDVDAWSVRIDNLTGAGAGSSFSHHAARLFRRARCEWIGRIHEQIARRAGHAAIVQAELTDGAWIRHAGYLDAALLGRNKAERNIRLAQAEVESADSWDRGYSLTSLGRSLILAGRIEEGLARLIEALETTDSEITRRLALHSAINAASMLGRTDEGLQWCERLREEGGDPNTVAALEASLHLANGDFVKTLELLNGIVAGRSDHDGFAPATGTVAAHKAQALAALGRWGNAADTLMATLGEDGVLDTHLGSLIDYMIKGDRPLDSLPRLVPVERIKLFMAQLLQLIPNVADKVLEAWIESGVERQAVLATAASISTRLSVERAVVWSARLRSAGYPDACPLVGMTATDGSPVERCRAAAVALRMFGDERAERAFRKACAEANSIQIGDIRAEVAQLCPELLPIAAAQRGFSEGRSTGPAVSIVIPCFNRAELTVKCLESLRAHTDPELYEVILVDNGSTDATTLISEGTSAGLRVIRNEQNCGFGTACNQGARLASSAYVCFLNNDTVVLPGWLAPLLAALDEDPALAAVQPKLIYPDGSLNDAGGLVFQGGTPWVYGKGHPDPCAPPFATRRAPDYASGACLVVRKAAFEEVGGFDDRYAPAYFEDTDLSFALRDRGWKVLYEPASTIIHIEGGTAGTDIASGIKTYQTRNAAVFAEKWADELAGRLPLDPSRVDEWAHRPQGGYGPGERPTLSASQKNTRGRSDRESPRLTMREALNRADASRSILVMDYDMPVFDRASGGLRMFSLLRCMREAGHSVTFYATGGGSRRYADALGRLGIVCYGSDLTGAAGGHLDRNYMPSLSELLTKWTYDMVVVSPWSLAEQVLPALRNMAPQATIVVDTNDIHFLRLERQASITGRPSDLSQATDTKKREVDVYRQADRIIAISDQDAAAVAPMLTDTEILVVPNLHETVDPGPGFAERSGLLFVGNFNHPPNRDAMTWWRDEIADKLTRAAPRLNLSVVGNDPHGFAHNVAGPGIIAIGTVESTLPYLHKAKVSVAPLRYGAGMKGKVGEALAAGLPVVATSIAIEGMGLVDGQHVLVADTAEDFVKAVLRLESDESLWRTLREQARTHIDEHFGLHRMRRGVAELIDQRTRIGS